MNKKSQYLLDQDSYVLKEIIPGTRVLIVEGIAGSGKDTFQAYLRNKLKGREVYDYSEGEVLHSWKQLLIEGISALRIKFMKLFVNYVRDIVSHNKDAVFLLNRFHLSTYASTVIQQPKLEKSYHEIVNVLRTLPVHVFILQLDESEIEKRSVHPERSAAWEKFQELVVVGKGSFRDRLVDQQRLMLETAKRQEIPYSVIRVSCKPEIGDGRVRISEASIIHHWGARIEAVDARASSKKGRVSPILYRGHLETHK